MRYSALRSCDMTFSLSFRQPVGAVRPMSYVTLRVILSDLVFFEASVSVTLSSQSAHTPHSRSPLSVNYTIFYFKLKV